jgi:hypothetical protein
VNFDASPRPRADERQAIGRAFDRFLGDGAVPRAYRSSWLQAALRENTAPWDPPHARSTAPARQAPRPQRRR